MEKIEELEARIVELDGKIETSKENIRLIIKALKVMRANMELFAEAIAGQQEQIGDLSTAVLSIAEIIEKLFKEILGLG